MADFFDAGNEPSSSEDAKQGKPESSQNKKMSEVLPEGFFDDPKMDAKVRLTSRATSNSLKSENILFWQNTVNQVY